MNKTQTNIDKATQTGTNTNINRMTQSNIEKVSKPTTAATPAPAASGTKPTGKPATANKNTKKKHGRVHFKPTVGGMLSLIALILIVAAVVTAVVFLTKGVIQWIDSKNTTESQTDDPNKGNQPLPWNNSYILKDHANSNKNVGDLILVNNTNPYSIVVDKSDLTSLGNYEGYNTYYTIRDFDIQVRSTILESLKNMLFALVDNNAETLGKDKNSYQLFISDAYTAISEESKTSEHHTGLAFNLKVLKPGENGKRENIALRESEINWLKAHCAEYGFIFRYDASKADITGVLDELGHFRYVGVPHATYMTEHGLCLEEYLELLRNSHKYDQTPLEFKAGEQDYLVYYVAANTAEGANFTSIPVPPASEGTYTISGDNMNGFIVTVTKAAK